MQSTKYPHLRNAPITEAVIEIRVKPREGVNLDDLGGPIHERIKEEYPQRKELPQTVVEINLDTEETGAHKKGVLAYGYWATDKKQILQIRTKLFAFHRLKPYQTWEKFYLEAKKLWQIYEEIAVPEFISKLSVRFINKLDIDLPARIEDYLQAPSPVPKGLPREIKGFLTRVYVPFSQPEATATITQALQPPNRLGKISIILDIDVFKEVKIDNSEEAWKIIEEYRDVKNQVFFESIKKKTRDMYQ